MSTWVSSDWHCQPGELKAAVREWIQLGKQGGHRLIGAGDLFDILPLGIGQWSNAASMRELAESLDGYGFDYVAGNHDPYRTVKRMMAPYPTITVSKRLDFEEAEKAYHCTHGHRWAVDWGFLGLRHVAPRVVEVMVEYVPGPWYWFCRRMGWLASELDPESAQGRERERINNLTRVIWAGASGHALKNGCCVVLGHTHTTGRYERGIGARAGCCAHMVDGGNLPDGSFIEITDDARISWLPASA